jgi:glycosyltransferase involved in cell wall biosynthesis
MKILVFNWQDIKNPLGGGAEVHLQEVFSRIAGQGHEVTLYCSRFPGAGLEEDIGGIHVIRGGNRSFFNFAVPLAYRRLFVRRQFDVVVDDMNKIPFFLPLFVKRPLVGVTHHLFDRSIYRETNVLVATYVYIMERAAVALYRAKRIPFIVGSPSTYQEVVDRGFRPEDVTVINYAVDHSLYRRTGVERSSTPVIGYIGRLKRYKSIDHLLHALPLVRADVPDIRLVIVGDGDDRPRLERIAREFGVEDIVDFCGFVSETRKVELLQQMWIKVTTSTKEGWGLTVLEANACGTPVLASNVPGLRDAVRDRETGILYPYGNFGALASGIVELLKDRTLRERLSANALRWAASFTWEAAAGKTLALLQQAVAGHRP